MSVSQEKMKLISPVQTVGCFTANQCFFIFLILHITLWTLAPTLFRCNLPMDALEGMNWGHQLQWGYDKNPWLNASLSRLALFLGGPSGWMTYLFSQLSVGLCLLAVWRLGQKILPPFTALVGVLMLEGLQYFNFHAIDFNDNTLELSCWALTVLFFYRALIQNKLLDWLAVGCFAALGMMAKYYTVVLLLSLVFFTVWQKEARVIWRQKGVYVAFVIFALVSLPHVIWLFLNDFVTVRYVGARVGDQPTAWQHIAYPAVFLWQQFEVLLPGLVLLLPLKWIKKTEPLLAEPMKWQAYDRNFLCCAGLGPLIITLCLSLFAGFKLRAGWGQPLLTYSGLLLLGYLRPAISLQRFVGVVLATMVFMGVTVSGYAIAQWYPHRQSSAIFPGKEIAAAITARWSQRYHVPLAYVAGPRWLAGNVAFYSPQQPRPAVYMEWDPQASMWIDEALLRQRGAVFVWDDAEYRLDPMIAELRERFPQLTPLQHLQFPWRRNANLPKIDVWFAFLPPVGKNTGRLLTPHNHAQSQ